MDARRGLSCSFNVESSWKGSDSQWHHKCTYSHTVTVCNVCVGARVCVRFLASLHLVEVSRVLVFTGDHVKEDGNGRPSQLLLGDQSHLQDGTHHAGDETDLVAAWKTKPALFKGGKKKKCESMSDLISPCMMNTCCYFSAPAPRFMHSGVCHHKCYSICRHSFSIAASPALSPSQSSWGFGGAWTSCRCIAEPQPFALALCS